MVEIVDFDEGVFLTVELAGVIRVKGFEDDVLDLEAVLFGDPELELCTQAQSSPFCTRISFGSEQRTHGGLTGDGSQAPPNVAVYPNGHSQHSPRNAPGQHSSTKIAFHNPHDSCGLHVHCNVSQKQDGDGKLHP